MIDTINMTNHEGHCYTPAADKGVGGASALIQQTALNVHCTMYTPSKSWIRHCHKHNLPLWYIKLISARRHIYIKKHTAPVP